MDRGAVRSGREGKVDFGLWIFSWGRGRGRYKPPPPPHPPLPRPRPCPGVKKAGWGSLGSRVGVGKLEVGGTMNPKAGLYKKKTPPQKKKEIGC